MKNNTVTCCYKCPKRTLGCHDTCTVYKEQADNHRQCVRALYKERKQRDREVFASHIVGVYSKGNEDLSKIYADHYYQIKDYVYSDDSEFSEEDQSYFFDMTDY